MQKFSCRALPIWQRQGLWILSISRCGFCLSKVKWLIVIYVMTQTQAWKKVCAGFPERMPLLIFIGFIQNPIRELFGAIREAEAFPRKRKIWKSAFSAMTSIGYSSVSKFTSREFKGKFGRKSKWKGGPVSGCSYFMLFRLLFLSIFSQTSESLVISDFSGSFFSFFLIFFSFPLLFSIKVKSCFSWCQ